jgi:fatty acid/phospholipid biosynthesis enzyme
MRIAVDAMGGDHAPDRPVAGALAAIRQAARNFEIVLVAFVSAVNPGAVMTSALTTRGRIEGLPRPAVMIAVAAERGER